MATRVRIAAAACLIVSGLFVSGAGAAVALADPDPAQSDDGGSAPGDPTDAGTPAVHSEPAGPSATGIATATATATPTANPPKPTSQIGDGRGGMPLGGTGTTRTPATPSKDATPTSTATPQSDTETTPTLGPPPDDQKLAADVDEPEEHPGWQWWPWCWPTPPGPGFPPGSDSSTGNGGGGGVRSGMPPTGDGIPRSPALPVVPVDPTGDVIGGLSTAAAQLPLAPIALPAVVAPLGAGGVGVGGPGGAPRPGPATPRTGATASPAPPPRAREQSPPAFSASNGTMPATYRAGYGQYLRTASVGDMAAVAVPGVTGILVLTIAGGLLGFRQARAGQALRANGTARFTS